MSLNPKQIEFFIARIAQSNVNTFKGNVSQVFNYLRENVKDNLIFNLYENEEHDWLVWFNKTKEGDWVMPGDFETAKTLAYNLYKLACRLEIDVDDFVIYMHETNIQRGINSFNHTFLSYFKKALDDIINANPEQQTDSPQKVKGTRVFIIHGHDELLKKDLQLLLYNAKVDNVVLHEQADKGRTVIDKLIEETKDANYGIALLTPDDLSDTGASRARQNVILEIGYFLGHLGKDRVRMVVKGNIEIPSDLAGILYEKYDHAGAWKIKILKELLAVGIKVDLINAVSSA